MTHNYKISGGDGGRVDSCHGFPRNGGLGNLRQLLLVPTSLEFRGALLFRDDRLSSGPTKGYNELSTALPDQNLGDV